MSDLSSHVVQNLHTEHMSPVVNTYSDHPLIILNQKHKYGKCQWKPCYVIIDCETSSHFSSSGFVLVCQRRRQFLNLLRKQLLYTVFIAFAFGFTLGIGIPLCCQSLSKHYPLRSNEPVAMENYELNYETLLSERVNSSPHSRLVDGIFWSEYVEKSLPKGFRDEEEQDWRDFVQRTAIVHIQSGCGRTQNRLVIFEDGTKACCRYRQNTDQIQGEMFSYYLGRLLKLEKLVPSTLAVINSSDPQWLSVKSQIQASQWAEDQPVVLTKFVDDLLPAEIPPALRHFAGDILLMNNYTDSSTAERNIVEAVFRNRNSGKTMNLLKWIKSGDEIVEMAQWSDLIIFDYLTANLDRIVNNLYNLQWNTNVLSSPAHNLAKTASSNLLVFLDNESGLLHGYRLLEKYEPYHSLLLDALCVFRKSTVDALSALSLQDHLGVLLSRQLPSHDLLPAFPDKNGGILSQRVARVLRQVVSCARKNSV